MNIVFDLGGVLFTWKPDQLIAKYFSNIEDQKIVKSQILGHREWGDFDRGVLSSSEIALLGSERTKLPLHSIKAMMNGISESLVPVKETIALIPRLKAEGHSLYVLSNMPTEMMVYLKENNSFFSEFKRTLFSCEVNLIKPEIEIYHHLLSSCQLDPSRTIFIDDYTQNVVAAKSCGIDAIHFTDIDSCISALKQRSCLVS